MGKEKKGTVKTEEVGRGDSRKGEPAVQLPTRETCGTKRYVGREGEDGIGRAQSSRLIIERLRPGNIGEEYGEEAKATKLTGPPDLCTIAKERSILYP